MKTENQIIIFTDGASRGNPGPGGYGAVIVDGKNGMVREIGGYEPDTTNNRMELRSAIEALLFLRKNSDNAQSATIYSDSAYVLNGITKWVHQWERNNWMTGQKEGVLNQDLWQALLELSRDRQNKGGVTWKKVGGHAGVVGNERGDEIATSFADKKSMLLFSGTLDDYEKMLGSSITNLDETASSAVRRKVGKSPKGEAYSYVSYVDKKINIDKTWAACEKRVKGKKGAKYKKAMTKEEENDLIALWSLESLI